jgi:glycosyltransferase involved in cell wall biosynthesis
VVVARICVILPVYNRHALIGRSIDSVLSQSFVDFELIVVDDGSTDKTRDVVRAFSDPRLRLVELPANRGSNHARNCGIKEARAPLIAFLDSDDLYLPNKLETVVRLFDGRPDLEVLVDSFIKLTSPNARRRHMEMRNPVARSTGDFASKLFRHELWKATSAISVKRDAAIHAGMFSEQVKQRQDLDFLIRLTAVANCASTDKILWVKTWSADRITNRARFTQSTLELVRRHPQFVGNPVYRVGLARDLARNFVLLLRDRERRRALADLRLIANELGRLRAIGLLLRGTGELLIRGAKLRLKLPRASLRAADAPAMVQNRASVRS